MELAVPEQVKKTPHARKGKEPLLSEAYVHQSLRIKKQHKGFKASGCKSKNCLGCDTAPPEISTSIIWDLGATFYSINPEELSDAKLQKKMAKTKPVSCKASRKKPDQS
jgi:hypothetical protein